MTTNQSEAQQKPKRETRSVRVVTLPSALSVKQLADIIAVNPIDIIKQLMRNGIMANINQSIDFDIAALIAADFGFKAEKQAAAARAKSTETGKGAKLVTKPPVITIMGHVDHGKTSLLDAIRKTNVTDTEAGAITQHIGAYQVELDGRKITFLDTPGHEAFTAMRARGAQSTDIAILVVAADDGIMPQTIEAINHAKAAGVPIIVAINKIDKANANVDRLKQQLADQGLLIEEWGGDTISVPVSAKKKEGIHDLLENLLVLADVLELKANPEGLAEGVTIEAKLDKSMGPLATVLVQKGTLKVGDVIVIGSTSGKIKAMFNDAGKPLKKAEPATPAKILGLNDVAQAGDIFRVVKNEREARTLLEKYRSAHQEYTSSSRALSLSDVSAQISSGEIKELDILLKTDVQGSIEPIRDSLERLSDDKIRVKVMHTGSGNITESDVMLALASGGIIVGFNTRAEPGAQRLADSEGIKIRYYDVIYELIGDVEKAVKGMLEPTIAEVIEGHAEIRAVFETKKTSVAGVMIKDGKVSRDSLTRVIRDGSVINESHVNSLKRFKNDVKEVASGFECGIGIAGFTEYKVGDTIEFYRMEKVA